MPVRRGSESNDVTGLLDLRMAHSQPTTCSPFPRSWDIRWSDLGLLLRCKFRDFRYRRERRTFDMLDSHHTGYVTLDELINFRDRLRVEGTQLEALAGNGQHAHHDLSKSLLALYHFDVALDGHFTFEEFLLLQTYLNDVEHDNDGAVVCRCIPKNWLRSSWWKRRLRALSHKPKKSQCNRERSGPEGPEDEQPLASPEKQQDAGEHVISRRVNDHGELHEIPCSAPECAVLDLQQDQAEAVLAEGEGGAGQLGGEGGDGARAVRFALQREGSEASASAQQRGQSWSESDAEEEEEEEEVEEEDLAFLAAQEEKKKTRRAMLVQALKSKKGRRRFIDWLYRLADTTESDNITMGELVTFLKAIHADGINPEVFIDPSEDYGDDVFDVPATPGGAGGKGSEQAIPSSPMSCDTPKRRYQGLDKRDPDYLDIVGSRIMTRYNESHSGTLSREEFMQLATMVEREYELSNDFSAADRVGPYRFIRTLGRGAEGVVKLAINSDDESAGKRAIKIIKRGNIASLSRIDTEIEAMVLLEHPTVVVCFEVLETESNICLVMEYCAGGHIEDYISPTRPMTESAARFYFTQLIDGLSYCHEHCVCHRDLRIENLMLDNKGDLKITDFGHAGIFQQGWDVFQTMLVGSVSHLAPEQVLGTVYSGEKIDMWSVGVILYIMVTGTAPFVGDTVEELLANIKEAKYEQIEASGEIAQDCLDVMAATMQVDYKERPGCQQIKVLPFMKGPREKLVLAHSDFFISTPQSNTEQIVNDIRTYLEDADTEVRDPKTTLHNSEQGEEEVEATVRTVSDDEDIQRSHATGMRPVSVTMFHCVHRTHALVFKVAVTMLSKDGGVCVCVCVCVCCVWCLSVCSCGFVDC